MRWILCTEQLPEKSGRYLVTRKPNALSSLWNRVYILNYSDLMGLKKEKIWWSGNVGKSDFEKFDDVIAWQPLPEPYKTDTKNEVVVKDVPFGYVFPSGAKMDEQQNDIED